MNIHYTSVSTFLFPVCVFCKGTNDCRGPLWINSFSFFFLFFFFSLMVATVGRKKLFGAEQIEKLRQFPTSSDSDPRST